MTAFRCHVCGSTDCREARLSEVLTVSGRRVLVENVPARVCARCGEAVISRDTTERVRQMLHGHTQPLRTEPLDVFALA